MTALIYMICPERRVDESHILNSHVLTVGDIGQSWALRILIGAFRVPRTAQPELTPVVQSVAIYRAMAANRQAIHTIRIHQGREILAGLSLDTRRHHRVVYDTVGALQSSLYIQVGALLEEEGTGEEGSLGNDDHAPTLLCGTVDDSLYGCGLYERGVVLHTIVGDHILAA